MRSSIDFFVNYDQSPFQGQHVLQVNVAKFPHFEPGITEIGIFLP